MFVWTVQSTIVRRRLLANRIHRVAWEQVAAGDREPFEAMASAMRAKRIEFDTAPVWAWLGEGSRESMAEACQLLLSEHDRSGDLVILRLDVPSSLAHLSSYTRWQDFYLGNEGNWPWPGPPERDDEAAQVTLPYIAPDWLVECLPVPPALW